MYIGIDIGGTNIRITGSEHVIAGKLIGRTAFLNGPNYKDNMQAIITAIHAITPNVTAIGIGTPGSFNDNHTMIVGSRTVDQWLNKPIVADLQKQFNCPVAMRGDQYCGALGEAYTQQTKQGFIWLTYGTGIGMAKVTHEAGLPIVQSATHAEWLEYLKPWQEACSGKWLIDTYQKLPAEFSDQEWEMVMKKFDSHFMHFLQSFQPHKVVFGGGMAVKQWPRLQALFKGIPYQNVDITLSANEENAGLVGSLALLGVEA